jgi:hypothetical protein
LLLLQPLARQQLRVVNRAQLRHLGWTRHQVQHEIDFGRWHAVAPNVIALQNAPLTHDQRLWLGVLHAGSDSVLSHLTACTTAGLRWQAPELIDVLTEKGDLVEPLDGFFFHQTRRPYMRWIHPGPGPARLRIEAAVLLAAERDRFLRRALGLVAASVQQGMTAPDRLLDTSRQITKLRNGRHIKLALGDIAGGAQSFAEIDIGRLCREAGFMPPTRQAIRKDKQGRRRYLDCEWHLPDGRIVVLEIDGSFHMRVDRWWSDMKRERAVVISGRSVLRCASVEIRLEPGDILHDLAAAGVPRRQEWAA